MKPPMGVVPLFYCLHRGTGLPMLSWKLPSTKCGSNSSRWSKCDFKVVGTVKKFHGPPAKICELSVLQRTPRISSLAVILTKFRSTGSLLMDETIFPAWERAFSQKKNRSLRPWNVRLQK